MILLWGLAQDPSTQAVRRWLSRWNAEVFFLNHADIYRTEVSMTTEPRLSFEVTCRGESCRLEECQAAYLRPYNYRDYPPPEAPSLAPSNPVMVHHLISAWAEYTPALVISRPSAEGTNQSKLYQAGEIRASGFLTPESLVTNDPSEIREFRARHGSLIYKSMSNVRSVVKELAIEDLDGKVLGPVQFQQRIAGQNIRVHVVGDDCFACAIETEGTDYRYAPSRMTSITLPYDVAQRAVALTRRLGLYLAGLDLILTPSAEWYCLEANPNPAFASFGHADAIAQAVARLLMAAPEPAYLAQKTARPPLNGTGPMGRNYAVLREKTC